MALHRKLRGSVDVPPQYIRIPTSSASQATGFSLHERQPRARRLYTQRYVTSDRSRKISSLQLRACFVLCVLLYFGAIYFADNIANLGRVVGSDQNNKNFFVHSLQPRGRGNVRVGRAVDVKRVDATAVPTKTEVAVADAMQHSPPSEILEAKPVSPQTEPDATTDTNNAEELRQEKVIVPPDDQIAQDGAREDRGSPVDRIEQKTAEGAAAISTAQADITSETFVRTVVPKYHRSRTEAQPTAARLRTDKEDGQTTIVAGPGSKKHIRGDMPKRQRMDAESGVASELEANEKNEGGWEQQQPDELERASNKPSALQPNKLSGI
ncbi:hypothetical protein PHYBOEH_006514 [Phytophthora boehmeriae]|uniref:Transmembrane protein n=1 Tax=Phytophthora boehmeriae TaxID=109152 RepID=A0A8T1WHN1_9STRA|nr:hypothetical protein PHYBOEH_006514 [Phytophthora boehmeriae]